MKHKVLIVDDDPNIRLVLKGIFSGCEISEAQDGKAGLVLIQSSRPSVVLLDLKMPVMNGIDALKKIKTLSHRPLIFVLTGNDDLDTAVKALDLGACGYITKPFSPRDIKRVVFAALAEKEEQNPHPDRFWRVVGKNE
ncbi:MAG: response regulator receiver [Elusimicrobia bacterium]|nr:MAG: response regulator receiver [Elusimicrobiota bacterium]KAF0153877.1 MAG: response regulator receiver [Elusimicrobiota bacterium]